MAASEQEHHATKRAEKFETILPADLFHQLEEWRKERGLTRSRVIYTGLVRVLKLPVPVQNRIIVGLLCLKCGAAWRFSNKNATMLNHNIGGGANPPTCAGRPVVVVE